MACVGTPTSTLFGISSVVSNSVSTSLLTTVSTIPGGLTTEIETLCAVSVSDAGPCPSEIITTIVSTLPDTQTTITNQLPVTIPVTTATLVPTTTLFAPCVSNPPPPSSQSSQSTSIPSLSPSLVFASPSVIVSASASTLPDGQLTILTLTSTSTPDAQTVYVSSVAPNLNGNGGDSGGNTNLGPIVGGTLGGIFGLLLIAGVFFCYRRSRRWDDVFEKSVVHGIGDDDERVLKPPQPAPYQYGLIGRSASPSASPPGSPQILQDSVPQHSRVNSSASVSVVSRDSTVSSTTNAANLLLPISDQRHSRRPSDTPLLQRPLQDSAFLSGRRQSLPTSPTTPLLDLPQSTTMFFVANTNLDTHANRHRPSSADDALNQLPPGAMLSPHRLSDHPLVPQAVLVQVDNGGMSERGDPPAYAH